MPKSRYYKILGLQKNASEKEVKKRYRTLVMKYHPDRNSDPKAQELFIRITEAYDIIQDENYVIASSKTNVQKTKEEKAKEREERMRKAQKRYKQQENVEKQENIRYYNSLISGKRWKWLKVTSIVTTLIAFTLIMDLFLPHHKSEDQLRGFTLNASTSLNGNIVGAIYTEKREIYYINDMDFNLFGETKNIEIETSWIFHNPIFIISKRKEESKYYSLNFTMYNASILLIILFLLPLFTLWYKRMSILFTLLFYTSIYGISALTLFFLLQHGRLIHLITFGYY